MNLKQFVVELFHQDVELWVEGDACGGQSQRLCVSAPEGVLTPETRDLLANYKAELILLLHEKNAIALKRSAPEAIATDTDFPLIKVDRTQKLPLSFAQERIWLLSQLEPDNPFYNELLALRLHGHLNIVALEQSLDKIIARHEALRTNFRTINEQPVQVIAESLTLSVPVVDLTELPEGKREIALQQLATAEAIRSFDLASSPLIRASVVKRKEVEHVLLLTIHHIVFDGWSTSVLMRELASIYSALCNNSSPELPELPIQYADFAIWQRQLFQTEVLQTQINYWKQLLKNAPTLLELPTDRPRPAVQTFRGARQHIELSLELSEALANFSRQERATLFMTLFTAFVTLLYRYTGSDDIVVGTPIANRDRLEIEGLIGFFVNTLVLRTDLSGNPSFQQVLNRVRQLTLEAYAHPDLPFEELVKALQPQRDLSHTPLFQVLFVLQNIPVSGVNLTGLTVSSLATESTTAKFDLSLVMQNTATGLVGMWEYNTDLFDASTIKRMALHFVTLLEAIVTNPQQQISQLPLLTEVEQRKLLVEWNDTQADYPDRCIHQLFEEQVQRTPDAVAVVFGNEQLTYYELNCRANQLAHYLKSLGVGAEVLVGLCVERSLEMVMGLLGILKAGGAYVPLDPEYPQERLSFMLEDTQLSVLLTQEKLVNKLGARKACVICLDSNWDIIDQQTQQNPTTSIKAQDLAYVMYTSGSTGQPKGVSIAHQGVVRLVKENDYASFSAQEVFLQFAPISFDAATFEIWGCLLNGGRLIIFPSNTPSINELGQVIEQYQVTTLWLTAGLFHLMVDENIDALKPLRQLLAGGDILSVPHVHKFIETVGNCQLINGYGPTENTTFTCYYQIPTSLSPDVSIPIGRPIANTQVYILDKNLQPVPIGVPGELHISGASLARGYFNRPELTQEKFIPNPFEDSLGSKLYKTGDLARYLPDGNIEYLGRIDNQVKIRGYRIELGEIEAVLSQHPRVLQVVVVVRSDHPGDKYLTAYVVTAQTLTSDQRLVASVVPNQESAPTIADLRHFLKQKLPDYMMPSVYVILDALPLTPNGKVDRRALPAPEGLRLDLETEYVAPRTLVEEMLAKIWAEVLRLEKVGIHDNFFDKGGHSLKATQVLSRVQEAFQLELPLHSLFEEPTIAKLSQVIEKTKHSDAVQASVIKPVSREKHRFTRNASGS